jgi:hypothetical protein
MHFGSETACSVSLKLHGVLVQKSMQFGSETACSLTWDEEPKKTGQQSPALKIN